MQKNSCLPIPENTPAFYKFAPAFHQFTPAFQGKAYRFENGFPWVLKWIPRGFGSDPRMYRFKHKLKEDPSAYFRKIR